MRKTTKMWIALLFLALLSGLTWTTIEPGKIRLLVLVLLGGFAFRIVLSAARSRYDEEEG